jgi:hypothetical protein
MHVFLELVTQFEYLYPKTIVMDIAISFGKWRGSQLGRDTHYSKPKLHIYNIVLFDRQSICRYTFHF